MLPCLKKQFDKRLEDALLLIDKYCAEFGLCWDTIGIFGSYARETATTISDVDVFIVAPKPDPFISGNLREDADGIGVDIVFITEEQLLNSDCLLCKNVRQDLKFIRGGEGFEKQLL